MTDLIDKNEAALSEHEAVCAERYTGINARLKRLEQILIVSAGFIITILLTLVLKLN
jgi:predicted nucleic acid-binding Zn ribbon protein